MNDERKTKRELVHELRRARARVGRLERSEEKRKVTVEELRERVEQTRHITELISDYVYSGLVFAAGSVQIEWVTPAFERITGYTFDEVNSLQSGYASIIHPDDWATISRNLRAFTNTQRRTFEYRIITKRGDVHWLRDNIRPMERVNGGGALRIMGAVQDFTEHKRDEESLVLLAHAIRSIGECVSVTDVENKILFVNDAFLRTYGYTPDELIGKPISIVRAPTTEPATDEVLSATIQGGWHGELLNQKKDGSEFPITLSTSTVRDREGRLLGLVGIAADITEYKRAELASRQARELLEREHTLLSTVIENMPDEICLKDLESRYLIANDASREALGVKSMQEMLGKSDLDYVRADMAAVHLAEEKAILESGEPVHNRERVRYDQKTGEIRKCVISTQVPVKNLSGKTIGLLVVNRDITERKLVEKALRESEDRYRQLVEGSPFAIAVHCEGRFVYVNPAAAQLVGAESPQDLVGKSVLEVIHPESRETILVRSRKLMEGTSTPLTEEKLMKLDGTPIYAEVASMPTTYLEKSAAQVIVRDITDRKRSDASLQATTEQLRELAKHLQNVREEEKKRLSQEFHDQLGQSLTALKMDLTMLQRRVADATRELSRSELDIEMQAMQQMIDQAIGSIREIMSELRPELLDQLGILPALESEAERFERRSGIPCEFNSMVASVDLDARRSIALFRIFQEALTNVSRHAQATRIRTTVRVDEGQLFLEIRDNGVGISPGVENRSSSFGLVGMRERALLLGGTLEIRGVKGEGTAILLRIPLAEKNLGGSAT